MRKILIALAICLLMTGIMAAPALAAAQKVALTPYPGQEGPGTAFMILNNSTGGAEFTLSLKGALPDAVYTIYANVDSTGFVALGTVATNKQGNGNFHANAKGLPDGTYSVVIAVNSADNFTRFWTDPALTVTIK